MKFTLAAIVALSMSMTILPAQAATIGVVQYNDITHVYERNLAHDKPWTDRLVAIYTNTKNGEFYKASHDRDQEIISTQYSTAFLCASRKDTSKCKAIDPNLNK